MKNFPNQASTLARVRGTLDAIGHLGAQGANVLDDGILGYELAARQLYTFRGINYAGPNVATQIAARIPVEQAKPAGSQGARTNAREMRRTLIALDWLGGTGHLSAAGQAFLATPPGSAAEAASLAQALLQLEVTDSAGNISHPVQIMLNLLGHAPSVHRDGLELALEALDDSPGELQRVLNLYDTPRGQRQTLLGASDAQMANAVKIFPTLALQAGLVVESPPGTLRPAPGPALAPAPPAGGGAGAVKKCTASKVVTAHTAGAAPQAGAMHGVALTPEEQQRAKELLAERNQTHQDLVRRVALRITAQGEMREDPFSYDLLWINDDVVVNEDSVQPTVLLEMKTVSGDAAAQVRRAVAQLSFYEYFQVRPEWPGHPVARVAVFDAQIDDDLVAYLHSERIDVMICPAAGPVVYARHSVEIDAPYALGLDLS